MRRWPPEGWRAPGAPTAGARARAGCVGAMLGAMASRIYTKRGDDGSTGRFLGGRVSKADPIVETCGDVDEAVAALGVARAGCTDAGLAEVILRLQRDLF